MPSAGGQLTLDLAGREHVVVGQKLRGVVLLAAAPQRVCTRLSVCLRRAVLAERDGERDHEELVDERVLAEDVALAVGQHFDFELTVPVGSPPSFDGDTVWLFWYVSATAEWRGAKQRSVASERLRVDPAPLSEALEEAATRATGSVGPYRRIEGTTASALPLWQRSDPGAAVAGLPGVTTAAARHIAALSRAVRRKRLRRAAREFSLTALGVFVFLACAAFVLTFVVAGLLDLFTKPSVPTAVFLAFLALVLVSVVPWLRKGIRDRLLPRLRDRGVVIEIPSPPRVAALGEQPLFRVRVHTRGQPIERASWELRHIEEAAYTKVVRRLRNTHRITVWAERVTRVDEGALSFDAERATTREGSVAEFEVHLPADRPSTIVTKYRVVRWELRVVVATGVVREATSALLVVPFTAAAADA